MAVVVRITRPTVQAAPGGQEGVAVEVTNVSDVVEQFALEVLGDAAPWAVVHPPTVSLMPGEAGRAEIVFMPGLDPAPPAGPTPFAVRAVSSRDPSVRMVAEATIDVLPAMAFEVDVRPRTSEGARSGRHEVIVTNRGNRSSRVTVTADDPDDLLAIRVEPAELTVEPGYEAAFELSATTMRGRSRQAQRQPFAVHVRPSGHPGVDTEAAFVLTRRRSPVPAVIAAILIVAGSALAYSQLKDDGPTGGLVTGSTTTEPAIFASVASTAPTVPTTPAPAAPVTTGGAAPTSAAQPVTAVTTAPPGPSPTSVPAPVTPQPVVSPTTATTAPSKVVPVRAAGQRFGTTRSSPCPSGAKGQSAGSSTSSPGPTASTRPAGAATTTVAPSTTTP